MCFAAWLVISAGAWSLRGWPRPVAVRPRLAWLGRTIRRPHLACLAAVLAGGYAYLVALGLSTPQNDGDPLVYQLTRAALWRQQESVGLIGVPIELRLDVNPIVAEVGQATTLVLAGSERFVWLVQLPAVIALALGAFALGRRVGIPADGALFAALLVPMLPVIAVQAISGLNDLVVASFTVAAAVFVLGRARTELVPLGLSVALAVGTKFTAPLALPVVALVGAVGQPVRRWPSVLAAGVIGTLAGVGWYVVNLVRTGDLDGGLAESAAQEPVLTFPSVLVSVQRLLLDSIERPGTGGGGVVAFMTVGLAIGTLGVYAALRGGRGRALVVAGIAIVITPLLVVALSWVLQSLFAAVWDAVGETDKADLVRIGRPSTLPDGAGSWYGPIATIVAASSIVLAVHGVRNRTLRRAAVPLALAPWLGLLFLALAISYDPWRGRFLVPVWVMSVAVWGVLEQRRLITACIVAVTALTFSASLVQYFGKPSGIDTLVEIPGPSIWSMTRWQAQTTQRGSRRETGEKRMIRAVERRVPLDATIGVSVWLNDFRFPYFGPNLERNVVIVRTQVAVPPNVDWLVAAPEMSPLGCSRAWRVVERDRTGWRLYQRRSGDTCTTPRQL